MSWCGVLSLDPSSHAIYIFMGHKIGTAMILVFVNMLRFGEVRAIIHDEANDINFFFRYSQCLLHRLWYLFSIVTLWAMRSDDGACTRLWMMPPFQQQTREYLLPSSFSESLGMMKMAEVLWHPKHIKSDVILLLVSQRWFTALLDSSSVYSILCVKFLNPMLMKLYWPLVDYFL
ncbi:hypothetical protein BCR42DRAFT_495159 [Absidia repens]|uniref:Uncharacterized protein n=1 Tax=Absidia repens TaxID=90262 RepID=A0A1X2I521_9FUNG|nr:hypothetical protein BCR42DRAFT_495159 [Absidia repens]